LISLGIALCAGVAACGGDSATTTTAPVETVDPLPKLPAHWHHLTSKAEGFGLGVAPRWRHGAPCLGNTKHRGKPRHKRGKPNGLDVVVLCAPDLLATVSIAVDRSAAALGVPVEEFATRAFAGVDKSRYGGTLGVGKPHPFGHLYDAVAVAGKGKLRGSGFAQDVELIVLRRAGLANFTVVVASNAAHATGAERRQAERMVRTLRDEPADGSARSSAPKP
jgi:hypothetical protein